MNQREAMINRNNTARLFRNLKRNCVRINVGNSYAHELKKFDLAYATLMNGEEFATECEFTFHGKNGRCDFVNLDTGIIYEILNSESEESINLKKEFYPLPIEKVYAFKKDVKTETIFFKTRKGVKKGKKEVN